MNHRDYLRLAEDSDHAEHISACIAAIVGEYGDTLHDAQRGAYKQTEAGIHLAWKLADGSYIYAGDPREPDPAIIAYVVDVGVGSIVEGSEVHVPLSWLGLPGLCHPDGDPGVDTPEDAVHLFRQFVDRVNWKAIVLREVEREGGA